MCQKLKDFFSYQYRIRKDIIEDEVKWILERKLMWFKWKKICLYNPDTDRLFWSVFRDLDYAISYCPKNYKDKLKIVE